ncbi:MAG: hypothetical protein II822_10760 [Prevotella sp.]|nr:hypothetical protein [Prevotella sp.]
MRKRQLLILAATALLTAQPAHAQFGKLKGLANKAKEKVTKVTGDKGSNGSTLGTAVQTVTDGEGSVAGTVAGAARDDAPWPMAGGLYKEKDMRQFLYNIADVSDEELAAMRDQCLVRYKSNVPIVTNWGPNADIAQQENQNFLRFLYEMRTIVSANLSNVNVSYDGAIDASSAHYLVTNDGGAGIGAFAIQKDGRFQFVMKDDTGTYLNAEELATARKAAQRMRKFQQLTYGLKDFLKEDPNNYDANLAVMYNLCGMYADAVEKACEGNTPENIERKPRPAAGSLNASMKPKALAVAKADDPEVVDVIITSSQWDVKVNAFGVPVNRNIYGYYIYKDEVGLQCCPRMWAEDYRGGKYGSLRKGGVGAGGPFYIK